MRAIQAGDIAKAIQILSKPNQLPDFSYIDEQGRSVLHHAVRLPETSVLSKILGYCSTEEATRENSRNGRTPLMTASNFGKTEACVLLLDKIDNKDKETEAILQQDTNFCNCIQYAAGNGHAETLALLFSRAAVTADLVKAVDGGLNTPLHKAAAGGHANVVSFLLDKGTNTNVENCDGMTPMQMAESAMADDWQQVVALLGQGKGGRFK